MFLDYASVSQPYYFMKLFSMGAEKELLPVCFAVEWKYCELTYVPGLTSSIEISVFCTTQQGKKSRFYTDFVEL